MPIRIKDIANTASASSTLDFFAIDGNTNNTRKLSAFSPTFGGSVVINQTLTANGILTGYDANGYALQVPTGAIIRSVSDNWARIVFNANSSTNIQGGSPLGAGDVNFLVTNRSGTEQFRIAGNASAFFSGSVNISSTAASSTTSLGALVIGNGTQGGLGVGGAINAGSSISSWSGIFVARAAAANPSFYAWTENTVAERGVLGFEAGSSILKYRAGGYSMSTGTEVFSITNTGTVTASNFLLGSNGPSVSSTLNARASRQGLLFDGTSECTVANGQIIGTGDFTIAAWVTRSGSNLSVPIWGAVNSIGAAVRATTITLDQPGGAGTVGTWTYTVPSNKATFIVIQRSGTTATAYVDGISLGTVSNSTNFSAAFSKVGLTSFSIGAIYGPYIYNRALSAAEVLSLYEAGAPAQADYNNANNTSLITGDNSTFATDTGYWTKANGATIGSGTCVLPNGTSYIGRANVMTVGRRYRVQLTNTAGAGNVAVFIGDGTLITTPYAASMTFEGIATTNGNITVGTSSNVTIDTLTVIPLGVLLAPDANQPGGGLAWYDTSGNNATITLPASGVSWNVRTSGQVMAGNGTTTAPSLAFANDTDTGFFLYGTNQLGFASNGDWSVVMAPGGTIYGRNGNNRISMPAGGGVDLVASGTNQNVTLTASGTGKVTIPGTVNSSDKTTGALVIGDGTNGGLGVSASIYAGGSVRAGTASDYVWLNGIGNGAIHAYKTGADGQLRLTRGAVRDWDFFGGSSLTIAADTATVFTLTNAGALTLGSFLQTGGYARINGLVAGTNTYLQLWNGASTIGLLGSRAAIDGGSAADVGLYVYGANNLTVWTNSTVVATFASSGATTLVGSLTTGGDVFVTKASPNLTLTRTANTNSALFQLVTGSTYDFAFGLRNTTDSDFHLYNYGVSLDALKIERANSRATFGGTVYVTGASVAFGALASLPTSAYISTENNGTEGFITAYNGSTSVYLPINYRATEHKFTSNGVVKVQNTTDASSTSVASLVVSGGLGVAKAIVAGGNIQSNAVFGANNTTLYLRPSGISVSAGQATLETTGNFTLNGDVGFAANNTYDFGSSTNRARTLWVRDLVVTARTVTNATDTGTAGTICADASYIYVCTATNTWKRVAIATWP